MGKRRWKMCSVLAFSRVSGTILMTLGKRIFPTHAVKQTGLLLALLEPPRGAVRCGAQERFRLSGF